MSVKLTDLAQLRPGAYDDIIDVRSPGEFAEDHLPGAINLAVLDDAERHEIGTLYKQVSPFAAKVKGAAMVSANAARHLQGPLAAKPGGWRPLVYCWRGGQRSGSFTTILRQIGWRAEILEGGYKSFRKLVATVLHDRPLAHRLLLLDGNTGTAKTHILNLLAERGVQTLDLEGLACHRGSLFGGMSAPQPSQKAFEAQVALKLADFDAGKPVVLEAESNKIGKLNVPPSLWNAMKSAPRLQLTTPLAARAQFLVSAYEDILKDHEKVRGVLADLASFHGHEKITQWQSLFDSGQFGALAAALMTDHYDPRYARSRAAHDPEVTSCDVPDLQPDTLAILADRLAASIETGQGWRDI